MIIIIMIMMMMTNITTSTTMEMMIIVTHASNEVRSSRTVSCQSTLADSPECQEAAPHPSQRKAEVAASERSRRLSPQQHHTRATAEQDSPTGSLPLS